MNLPIWDGGLRNRFLWIISEKRVVIIFSYREVKNIHFRCPFLIVA